MRPLRIAMIGQRGIPATFGGIEHHVEELGQRLAARGHEVIVYTRTNYATERPRLVRGMRPRYLPTVGSKHLDAIVHSGLSTLDVLVRGADIVHYHAVGPGIPAILPRLVGRARVVLTVHGLDAERAKWSATARTVLNVAQWLSARVPDATIVVSRDLERHYRDRFRRSTTYIPNGVTEGRARPAEEIGRRWGLEAGSYVLFLGRLVPEKAPDLLIRAFRRVDVPQRLVIAGGSSFTDDYVRGIQALVANDDRIVLPGYVYGDLLEELYANAAAFVLPSSLEGLPLTLLEAASYGLPLVTSDIAPNLEVVGHDAPGHRVFHVGDEAGLAAALQRVLGDPSGERAGAEELRRRVVSAYSWDAAAEMTESLYERLVGTGSPRRSSARGTPIPDDRRLKAEPPPVDTPYRGSEG
jgi:glycosyltransferase involved in cell wall biosynthesis